MKPTGVKQFSFITRIQAEGGQGVFRKDIDARSAVSAWTRIVRELRKMKLTVLSIEIMGKDWP